MRKGEDRMQPKFTRSLKKRGLNAQLCAPVYPWIDLHYQNK